MERCTIMRRKKKVKVEEINHKKEKNQEKVGHLTISLFSVYGIIALLCKSRLKLKPTKEY